MEKNGTTYTNLFLQKAEIQEISLKIVFKSKVPWKVLLKKKVIKEPLHFPSVDKHKEFEWIRVSVCKNSRDSQIQAFVEGLQKSIVVVLNRGAGKTLVASMILAKLCKLNANGMGLMLVDRVPRVFQQGDAIADNTNLSAMSFCGEKIKQKIVSVS